jgi:RNA polymerase sigma-54 factor
MKLLQVPTANLEERIKEELEENPALEMESESAEDEYELSENSEMEGDSSEEEEYGSEELDAPDVSEFLVDDDGEIADYKMKDDNYPEMSDEKVIPMRAEISFQDHLLNQLGMLELDQRNRTIAEQIIGSLDDDGYLRSEISSLVDDMAFRQGMEVSEKEVMDLLAQIQQFDPPGIAARSLQECLLLQLSRKESEGESVRQAIQMLTKYFDEFTKKHYEKIQRSMNLNDEQLKDIIAQIIRLI